KTTLRNRILHEPHGFKIAVIENEFGQENIDNEILVQESREQIIEMNNGCICCTVRGDLIMGLTDLARRRAAGEIAFDHIVIETTGLANPGPVAQSFFIDDEVASEYVVNAVVTVVDARHALHQLDTYEEAQRQVGFADKLLLSKTDLVDADAIQQLMMRLQRINPRAPIVTSDFGQVAIAEVLDLRGFNLNDKLELDPDFISAQEHAHDHACDEHCDHEHHHHDHHHAQHSDNIAAFVFQSDRPFQAEKLDEYLGTIVQVYGPRMLRYKGVLWMDGADRKVIFQGVHQIMGTDIGQKWEEGVPRSNKMVFIGQNLPQDTFIR